MNGRRSSRREAAPLAFMTGLLLLAASAHPGRAETAGATTQKAAPTTTAAQKTATTTATTKAGAATTTENKTTAATTAQKTATTTAVTPKPAAATTTATKTPSTTASDSPPGGPTPDGKKATQGAEALRGGQEGTVFKSLTVEGEDRVRIDFERPELEIDLDVEKAPGLDWGSAADVLNRTATDLQTPLVTLSAKQVTPYLARPWLSEFATGPVARFHPDAEGVERWKLTVVNSKGATVTTFSGKGDPPKEIAWDGRAANGAPVTPGLTYSYVFEAFDRAGNKRNVVGQGFTVTAYRIDSPDGTTLLLSASELQTGTSPAPATPGENPAAPPILLEAASWLNQSERLSQPIRVTVTARSKEQADGIAGNVKRTLAPLVIGDPARFEAVALVEPDAPEAGTLIIAATK